MKFTARFILFVAVCWVGGSGSLCAGVSEANPKPTLLLTEAERAWISAHPVVRVAVGHDSSLAPYHFWTAEGQLAGINVDYLELIGKRTGLRFEPEIRPQWAEAVAAFKAGEADILMSLGRSAERETYMNFTIPYGYSSTVVILREGDGMLFRPDQLNGRRIGLPGSHSFLIEQLREMAPQAVLVKFHDMNEVLQAVSAGEIDATIGDLKNCLYLVGQLHLSNLRLGGLFAEPAGDHIGVRRDMPELVGILNKAIENITPEERHRIGDRWVPMEESKNWRWALAFRIAAAVAILALVVFALVFVHNRRLARELAERRRVEAELARVSREKSELLRMVAHDLRSPLTGLRLGAELLEMNGAVDERIFRETIGQIRSTTEQMIRLADELVDTQAIEEGYRNFRWEPIDACALMRAAVTAQAEMAARKSIRLVQTSAEPAMKLVSDADGLRQIADNLISNALKYSPPHTEVRVELRRAGASVQLRVIDQGPGISAAEQGKLFQKYAQGAAKPTGGEKSTGLGLWIVQKLVTGLNGRVWCESTVGQGAMFVVELPSGEQTA